MLGTCLTAAAANRDNEVEGYLQDADYDYYACNEFYYKFADFLGDEGLAPIRMDTIINYFNDDDGEGGAVYSLYSREGPMDFSATSLVEWAC
jgi:hypothetical protein